MRIRRIVIVCASVGVLSVALAVTALLAVDRTERQRTFLVTDFAEAVRQLALLRGLLPAAEEQQRAARQWRRQSTELTELLESIRLIDETIAPLQARIVEESTAIGALFETLVRQRTGGGDIEMIRAQLDVRTASMIGDAIAITRVVEARHEAWRTLAGLVTALSVLMLGGTVFGLLHVLNRQIAAPIEELAQATVAIGSGDLDRRVAVSGAAEVTLLARSVDRMRASLRAQNQRRSEFLAMLSHELRNPLAPMRTSVHVLERTGVVHPAAERALDILKVQTAHLARIVGDLLDTNRIGHGALELRVRWTDLRRIVSEVVAADRATAVEHVQDIVCELPPDPVGVQGDADRLRQIVSNLVQNAIKFGRIGGVVRVTLVVNGDHCELCVSDDGEGIPPAVLERIFEPFFQAPQAYSRPKGGLGLGLALVKNLTEMHGGSVRAESPGPGRGARFSVRLPVAPRPSREETPSVE